MDFSAAHNLRNYRGKCEKLHGHNWQVEAVFAADKLNKDTCKINWEESARKIYDHIRGLSPFPTAWTNLKNKDELIPIKIYKAKWQKEAHNFKSGTIKSTKKELKVATPGGYIYLLELQLPGKRKMAVADVLNGLKIEESAYMT